MRFSSLESKAICSGLTSFPLSPQGYFSLVLCTGRFLVSFHNHRFGDSWLEPKQDRSVSIFARLGNALSVRQAPTHADDNSNDADAPEDTPHEGGRLHRRRQSRRAQKGKWNPLAWVHQLLIAANALIIVGSTLRNDDNDNAQSPADFRQPTQAVALRATGQAIFLAINLGLIGCIVATVMQVREQDRRRAASASEAVGKGFRVGGKGVTWYGHPFLLLLLATAPFLITRGVFGVCQSVIHSLNVSFTPELFRDVSLTVCFSLE